MKSYDITLHELEEFGVISLTGEADAYEFRQLCDLTEDGVKLIQNCLGSVVMTCPKNWNSKGIASIMLPRSWAKELLVYAILSTGQEVLYCPEFDGMQPFATAYDPNDAEDMRHITDFVDVCNRINRPYRMYRNWSRGTGQPCVGDRNTHAFTGRTI